MIYKQCDEKELETGHPSVSSTSVVLHLVQEPLTQRFVALSITNGNHALTHPNTSLFVFSYLNAIFLARCLINKFASRPRTQSTAARNGMKVAYE